MQTNFSAEQLKDPKIAHIDGILRACVHCGFCTATCPTYVLLGDELDSPRGRIYLIKDMLENGRPATPEVVTHIDRCLSCLSCMTTCPSGVNYMHLVDYARGHIERTYERGFEERVVRRLIATILPRAWLFRLAMLPATLLRPLVPLIRRTPGLDRIAGMIALAPRRLAHPSARRPGTLEAGEGFRNGRVVVMQGCAQQVLKPEILDATVNVLTRHGFEVSIARGEVCCGALNHHLGNEKQALSAAKRNIDVWLREAKRSGLEAIIITASGCGTTVKDYPHMLRGDPVYEGRAERVAGLAKDIHEFLAERGFGPTTLRPGLTVAYHSACSMQHGQRIRREPRALLEAAGFAVKDVPEGHLCCGSAGSYNMLQPEIAAALLERKVANIERLEPDLIATGNIGCITQIAAGTDLPIVHTIELLDWATGGAMPKALEGRVRPVEEAGEAPAPVMADAAE